MASGEHRGHIAGGAGGPRGDCPPAERDGSPGSASSQEDQGLPPLPLNRIGIFEGEALRSPESKALAEEIRATLLGGKGIHAVEIEPVSAVGVERYQPARPRSRLAVA